MTFKDEKNFINNELPAAVEAMKNISITGNIVPSQWFKTITFDNGKPDTNSILILSDFVYWYRPSEVRDERSGAVICQKKKFAEDLLRRSYSDLENQFGLSKKQCRDCLIRLENLGVIRRVLRNVNLSTGLKNNVMYIDLVPTVLERLTRQSSQVVDEPAEKDPGNFKVTTCLHQSYQGVPQKLLGGDIEVTTIKETNTSLEITPNISLFSVDSKSESPVVVEGKAERESSSISERIISIWGNLIPEKKTENISKQLRQNLERALLEQLDGDLENWKVVCTNFRSSKFLMGEVVEISMKPSLSWLVNPHKDLVSSVFSKEQWVFDDRPITSKKKIDLQRVHEDIEASPEPIQAKEVRHLVSQESPDFYQSYFLKASFALEDGTLFLKASTAFAADKISEAFFGKVQILLKKKHKLDFKIKYD